MGRIEKCVMFANTTCERVNDDRRVLGDVTTVRAIGTLQTNRCVILEPRIYHNSLRTWIRFQSLCSSRLGNLSEHDLLLSRYTLVFL